jgi:uncharacterized protein YecA (UPF0149 family)
MMDVTNGRIYDASEVQKMFANVTGDHLKKLRKRLVPMHIPPTATQMQWKPPRVGRNDDCPCGSGKKFKHCCLRDKHDERFKQ